MNQELNSKLIVIYLIQVWDISIKFGRSALQARHMQSNLPASKLYEFFDVLRNLSFNVHGAMIFSQVLEWLALVENCFLSVHSQRLKCKTKMCPWAYVQRVTFWVLEHMLKQWLSVRSHSDWAYAHTAIERRLTQWFSVRSHSDWAYTQRVIFWVLEHTLNGSFLGPWA